MVIAFAAVRLVGLADPGATPGSISKSWIPLCLFVAIAAVVAALFILGYGVGASIEQRRSRRQLPPRPGPGGHALDGGQRGGAGHGPIPPSLRTVQVLRGTEDADGGGAGGADVVVF